MSRKPIVAYQGIAGAYSHLACTNALPDHQPLPCMSFEDMLAAVQDGEADRAMVPVENSVAGRVADIHHLLPESGLFIVGEYFQRVNHMLLGLPGTRLEDLKEVRAHPQGLAQCRKLIKRLGLQRVNHADNAGAAEEVAKSTGSRCWRIRSRTPGTTPPASWSWRAIAQCRRRATDRA
jgi:prephenate dehydratase